VTDTPSWLAKRLEDEGHRVLEFFHALADYQWQKEVYSEENGWTVYHIMAHLVSAEIGIARLVQNVVAGGPGSPDDFDLDGYNQRKVRDLQGISVQDLMDRFSKARQENSEMVARFTPTDMQRTGRHPWLGITSVGEMVKLLYRHNQIHLRDIRRALD